MPRTIVPAAKSLPLAFMNPIQAREREIRTCAITVEFARVGMDVSEWSLSDAFSSRAKATIWKGLPDYDGNVPRLFEPACNAPPRPRRAGVHIPSSSDFLRMRNAVTVPGFSVRRDPHHDRAHREKTASCLHGRLRFGVTSPVNLLRVLRASVVHFSRKHREPGRQ